MAPWYYFTVYATITLITHTHSLKNWLCHYDQFTNNGIGSWSHSPDCTLSQETCDWGAVTWLASHTTWTDYTVECTINVESQSQSGCSASYGEWAGIIFRAQWISDLYYSGKYYYVSLVPSDASRSLALLKFNNVTAYEFNQLAADSSINIAFSTDYTVKIQLSGNVFTVYVDGNYVFSKTDSNYTFGSVGLRTYNSKATFKDLHITGYPTPSPTAAPNTSQPSTIPTESPSYNPTYFPSQIPTFKPTIIPTIIPTHNPTNIPTLIPTNMPTIMPTNIPSISPSHNPTFEPTFEPSHNPSLAPTVYPSYSPSLTPTISPFSSPTNHTLVATKHTKEIIVILLVIISCFGFFIIVFFYQKRHSRIKRWKRLFSQQKNLYIPLIDMNGDKEYEMEEKEGSVDISLISVAGTKGAETKGSETNGTTRGESMTCDVNEDPTDNDEDEDEDAIYKYAAPTVGCDEGSRLQSISATNTAGNFEQILNDNVVGVDLVMDDIIHYMETDK